MTAAIFDGVLFPIHCLVAALMRTDHASSYEQLLYTSFEIWCEHDRSHQETIKSMRLLAAHFSWRSCIRKTTKTHSTLSDRFNELMLVCTINAVSELCFWHGKWLILLIARLTAHSVLDIAIFNLYHTVRTVMVFFSIQNTYVLVEQQQRYWNVDSSSSILRPSKQIIYIVWLYKCVMFVHRPPNCKYFCSNPFGYDRKGYGIIQLSNSDKPDIWLDWIV